MAETENRKPLSCGLFITGTDTAVGKTAVACALARAFRSSGIDCGAMKPIATGCTRTADGLLSDDARQLAAAAGNADPLDLVCPERFETPASPLAASRIESREVDVERIRNSAAELLSHHDLLVVEGIGGIAVPIAPGYSVLDLMRDLSFPVVLVARAGLGTLNHTALSVMALKHRSLELRGIVLNRPRPSSSPPDVTEKTNGPIIEEITGAKILADLPRCPHPEKDLAELLRPELFAPELFG